MSDVATDYESDEARAMRAQKHLTERVAVRLVRKSRSSNLRLGTWAGRMGLRRHDRDSAPVS